EGIRSGLPAAASAAAAATTTAAATAATAAAVATATTAVAAATAPAATTPATTTAAILGLFDGDLTSLDVAAVHLLDRLACLILGRHLDEAEATRPAGLAVGDDLRVRHGSDAAEQVAQVQLGDRVRQISNVESRSHVFLVAVIVTTELPSAEPKHSGHRSLSNEDETKESPR